jgi:MSHA pilin protein MshD
MNMATKNSADPMIQKQALAIAEALIEQVSLMPFCDPAVRNPNGTCTAPDPIGPEAGEVHGSLTPFDNVNDYDGLALSAGQGDIASSAGVAIPAGYSANISVVQDGTLGPAGGILPAANVYLITVTVNVVSTGSAVVLHAYRALY